MTLSHYMYGDEPGWSHPAPAELSPGDVASFAEQILHNIEDLPPDPTSSRLAPADTQCVLRAVGSHWGVYGAGVTAVAAGEDRRYRQQILLDPAWLDLDFRLRRARQPWLLATEAEWAATRLRAILNVDIPEQTVLRASLPPEPYAAASGDRSIWPSASTPPTYEVTQKGTLGPPVSFTDDTGRTGTGFLTAGHVVPPRTGTPGLDQVDLHPAAGTVYSATVHRSAVPAGIHPGLAAALAGAVDAAVIDAGGHPVSGLGPRGGAGHTAAVVSLVAGAGRAGEVVGYAVWVATADSAWRDCYMVAAPDGAFSEDGHSGAAVLKHGKVIGIVLGGAAAVAGCPAALSYVQDIDAITSRFGCMVIP